MGQSLDVAQGRRASARDLKDKRVLVLGLARQGTALARFLLSKGAKVTVSDSQTEDALQDALQELEGLPICYVLGGHPASLLDDADLVCLSGGVPPTIAIVEEARSRGIPLSNDAQFTLERCPAHLAGITGSSGKTTTTTLVGLMMTEAEIPVHVGGNIGKPLIDRMEGIRPSDWAVMELSSFQLELCDRSPEAAVVTNVTPNHLDRHRTMGTYTRAKANILRWQTAEDVSILSADDPITGHWLRQGWVDIAADHGVQETHFPIGSRRMGFSVTQELAEGAFVCQGSMMLKLTGRRARQICPVGHVRLRGQHNVANLLAACLVAAVAGAPIEAMASVAASFSGVEHRLEPMRELRGVSWVNDSIATSPERSMAAIKAFHEPIILLAGGRDKDLPWGDWASLVLQRVKHLVLFGEAAELIETAIQRRSSELAPTTTPGNMTDVLRCGQLEDAVAVAHDIAQPGDVVLLSPGCTSFDSYKDFAARGEHFRLLVQKLRD